MTHTIEAHFEVLKRRNEKNGRFGTWAIVKSGNWKEITSFLDSTHYRGGELEYMIRFVPETEEYSV